MSNPKDRIGVTKVPLGIFPPAALAHAAVAMHDGASKYGRWNWRGEKVAASVYIDACMRHLLDWYHGEEEAEDSGAHHLGHAIACLAIILDAQGTDNLIDDRPAVDQNCSEIFAKLSEKVKRINELREPAQSVTRDQTINTKLIAEIVIAENEKGYAEIVDNWVKKHNEPGGVAERKAELEKSFQEHAREKVKGCCAPSIFAEAPGWEPPRDPVGEQIVREEEDAAERAAIAAEEEGPQIGWTEALLGHKVDFIDETCGYIDGVYRQGTDFRCTVARWRKGFETIDDEMENHYATTNSE